MENFSAETTAESIKLIKKIIIPYIEKERILLKLPKTQPACIGNYGCFPRVDD